MSAPTIIAVLAKNSRERVRVALDNYRGHDLVDVRIVTKLTEGTDLWTPTKKGVSINIASLPALCRAFQDAETAARSLGLIGGEV